MSRWDIGYRFRLAGVSPVAEDTLNQSILGSEGRKVKFVVLAGVISISTLLHFSSHFYFDLAGA